MKFGKVANLISKDRFKPVLEKVVTELREELGEDLEGVLLGGVPFDGGDLTVGGLEFFVVIAASWRQRRTRIIDGVDVELVIEPTVSVREQCAREDLSLIEHSTLAAFAHGRILRDAHGVMATLAEDARAHWNADLPPVTREDLPRLRHRATELLKDAQAIRDVDEEQTTYLLFHALEEILATLYRLHRWRPVAARHLLADLRHRATELEPRVRRILAVGGSASSRVFWLGELVREVLSPVGGTLDEWESPREDVPMKQES